MWVKETDYWYKDTAIDILERLEMLRQDIITEINEREQDKDFNTFFLHPLLSDVEESIRRLIKYRDR